MNYVIVWKQGANILKDGQAFTTRTKKHAINFWLKSESVKIGKHFILFFGDGTIYDDILYRKFGEHSPWRHDYPHIRNNKSQVKKYVKTRMKNEK